MAQVLDEKFGIVKWFDDNSTCLYEMIRIHRMHHIQRVIFVVQEQLLKILFQTVQVLQKRSGLVLPNLKGKLDGSAQRVPTLTGSLTEVTAMLGKKVQRGRNKCCMKAASNESFGYTEG
jgi:glyceraldehyde 3-phosphate dehydrogenase